MTTQYTVRRGAESYGHAIGILLIDCSTPFIPGDVGNATTYPFPVLYRTVPDVTLTRLIDEADKSLTDNIIRTAKELEMHGVRAISSDCGYMIHFQSVVAEAVSVPVIMSSLIQLPMLERTISKDKRIGLICAKKSRMTEDMLLAAGLQDSGRVVIYGMEHSAPFRNPILEEKPLLDASLIAADMVNTATSMIEEHPEIGPILLECSNMPPYAQAVQRATGRPVFDFTTLIGIFETASFRRPFHGFY